MSRLAGRVAIVTGAGGGIGKGIARALAAAGAHVVIASRGEATGSAAAAELARDFGASGARARWIQTDVGREDSVRALVAATVEDFGRLDILVSNATPAGRLARLEEMTDASMDEYLRVNHWGVFWAMQAAFPHMRQRGWGRIITLCSLNGVNAHQYSAAYNSSKEAARALTRTAAVEWGRYGITCNVLCPAAVTPPWQAFLRFDPEGARRILDANPMRRLGDAEADVGPVAVFLASDESRYVTGNTLHVDGGGHINGVPWQFEPPA